MIDFKSRYLLAKAYDTPEVDTIYTLSNDMAKLNTPQGLATFEKLFVPSTNAPADKKVSFKSDFDGHEVDLYIYFPDKKPEGKLPLIYFIHGGGYLFGAADQLGSLMKELANTNNVIMTSVEYRLATQAPFPADIHDCAAGLRYVFANGETLGADTSNIAIMGASAGGGLAARLGLFNRDHDNFPLKGQLLIYPMLDYRTGTPEAPIPNPFGGQLVWTPAFNQKGWTALRGGQTIPENEMPYYSAAMAKTLAGLPHTFMIVGNMDLFSVEVFTYGQRLIVDGVPCEFHQIYGVYHAFDMVEPNSPETQLYHSLQKNAISRMFNKE